METGKYLFGPVLSPFFVIAMLSHTYRFLFKCFFLNLLIFKFFLIAYNHRFTGVTTGLGLAFKMFDL